MYKIGQRLGQGAFGIVYHLQLSNGSEFALKIAEIDRLKSDVIDSVTEARLMLKLSHAHLVQCCATFSRGRHIYLVMELCRHGTLKHFLNVRTKLVQEARVLAWLGQMADALRYLHVYRVIHRDLKTDNIFLDDRRNVKVGDLGIARELDYTAQRAGTFIGTFCYMSPEVLQSSTYSYETDIWSLGCCIHEVMTLRQTFAAQSMMDVMGNIMEARIPPMPDVYSKKLQHLVLRMLNREPKRRPDGLEILLTVSKIQGFPFESGPYIPLENFQINQKLLCEAVQDFEHKLSRDVGTTSYNEESTSQSANARDEETEEAVEKENDRVIDFVELLEEQCLKAKQQPRPLPRCRYMNQDVPVDSEKELAMKRKIRKQEKGIKVGKNKLPIKQNHQLIHHAQAQHYPVLKECSSSPRSSPACESRFVLDASSSLSSSHVSMVDSREKTQETYSDSGDASMSINEYIDRLATESQQWQRLKVGLSENGNVDDQIIDDQSDSDSPVTLYTRAQVVKYSNRKGKSENIKTGHVT